MRFAGALQRASISKSDDPAFAEEASAAVIGRQPADALLLGLALAAAATATAGSACRGGASCCWRGPAARPASA